MSKLAAFGHWLATPARALRALFPFTLEGRQTLIYLVFAGAGPAMTLLVMWAMNRSIDLKLLGTFAALAHTLGWSLLIIVSALGCFVSIRAIKLGKDGFGVEGRDQQQDEAPVVRTTTTTDTTVVPPPG